MGDRLQRAANPKSYHAYWEEGLRVDRVDERFLLEIGGRLQVDGVTATEDDRIQQAIGEIDDDIYVRRGRLDVDALWNKRFWLKAEYDVADEAVGFRRFYLDLVAPFRGVDGLRVGFFPEPFGLENTTSSNYSTFMERGLPYTLTPRTNMGFALRDSALDDRVTWFAGGFYQVKGFDDRSSYGQALTGRATCLPWDRRDENRFVHLGLGASLRRLNSGQEGRLRTRPETGEGPYYLDTGEMQADAAELLGLEAAWVNGPLSLQAELIGAFADLDEPGVDDETYPSYYILASYFLTGESRPYANGQFKAVTPRHEVLGPQGGWGAWEVAARYSAIDLTDDRDYPSAGELHDVTLGLNWYLSRNTRIMFNYTRTMVDRNDVDGDADIFQTRFQIFF